MFVSLPWHVGGSSVQFPEAWQVISDAPINRCLESHVKETVEFSKYCPLVNPWVFTLLSVGVGSGQIATKTRKISGPKETKRMEPMLSRHAICDISIYKISLIFLVKNKLN